MSENDKRAVLERFTQSLASRTPLWLRLKATLSLWDLFWCLCAVSTAYCVAARHQ
jgi:hypothetical protein